MTSERDSPPRRRPPTIDLKATAVETGQPASAAENAAPEPPPDEAAGRTGTQAGPAPSGGAQRNLFAFARRLRPRNIAAYAISALAGAVAMLVAFAALWIAGLLPRPGSTVPPSAQVSDAAKDISARLDQIDAALSAQRPDASVTREIASAEAATKTLGDSLTALNRRIDDVAVAAKSALARADAAAGAAEAAKNTAPQAGVERSELDALANRIAALEGTVKTLSEAQARRPAGADDHAARAAVAAEALRAAVERGAPYESELAAVKAYGIDTNTLAPLDPFAAEGIPNAASLARDLAALTPALARASNSASGEGSFLGRLQSNAQKLVRITPIGAPSGDDPAAVLARIDGAAARADIAAALAEITRLPAPAQSLAGPWVRKAEEREKAIAASRRIAADALAALNRPVSQ